VKSNARKLKNQFIELIKEKGKKWLGNM